MPARLPSLGDRPEAHVTERETESEHLIVDASPGVRLTPGGV
jgi:hypothetical protein